MMNHKKTRSLIACEFFCDEHTLDHGSLQAYPSCSIKFANSMIASFSSFPSTMS